jgi:predicted GNAT family acetyltransferase
MIPLTISRDDGSLPNAASADEHSVEADHRPAAPSQQGSSWRNRHRDAYVEKSDDDEGMPMTAAEEVIAVTRNDEDGRYEIHVGDVLAGYTKFRVDPKGRLIFPHTEIDPAFRGRGIAQRLVADAMADVARRGETVIPHCPVVAGYLHSHEVPGLDILWPKYPHPE